MGDIEQTFPVSFKLEKYFSKHYDAKYMMSGSDAEALTLKEILAMADDECLDMWNNMKFSYTTRQGHPLLLKEAADIHAVDVSEVLEIVPQEGIFLAMQVLVRYLKKKYNMEKLHAVATFPAYQSLHENLHLLECDLDYWTVSDTPAGWRFQLDHLKGQLRSSTKLLVVNFPHNPTGALPDAGEWQELIDICKLRDIFLFSDEMYRFSNLDGAKPLVSACAAYDDAISLFGMSKSLALPALRVGWVCTRNKVIMRMMQDLKDYTTICGPYPSEVLSIIALKNRDGVMKRTVDICHKNLAILSKFCKKHEGLFEWKPPKACTTGFLRIQGWLLSLGNGGATGFCEELVERTGLLLLPSSIYSYLPDEYVRLGFGRVGLPEMLDILDEFIEKSKPE